MDALRRRRRVPGSRDSGDIRGRWDGAVPSLQEHAGMSEGAEWDEYVAALTKDGLGGPTAYVFKCLHCGQLGGYSDAD